MTRMQFFKIYENEIFIDIEIICIIVAHKITFRKFKTFFQNENKLKN